MKGKIGLEEHFAINETLMDSAGFVPDDHWPELRSRILDIHDRRLRLMDHHGMQMMLLSVNAPAVQAIPDPKKADEIARRANDFLAEEVSKRPDRFQALAALPMHDPELASTELLRCVQELGFKGALVNGFSQIDDVNSAVYYDCRSTGLSGESSKRSTCRSICILAIRSPPGRKSTKATLGCSDRPGLSRRKQPYTRCG
jgi:2,3-dihydroxybenzoate decarboxylase